MILTIDPNKAPLRNFSGHRQEVELQRLVDEFSAAGIEILQDSSLHPGQVRISLRNIVERQGSITRAKQFLVEAIALLGAEVATWTADSIAYLNYATDPFLHAVSRGVESGVVAVSRHITNVTADHEGHVPIFDALDRAAIAVAGERIPDNVNEDALLKGAADDLRRNGFNIGDTNYRQWLDVVPVEEPRELPQEFRTSPKPYRSPFDPVKENF